MLQADLVGQEGEGDTRHALLDLRSTPRRDRSPREAQLPGSNGTYLPAPSNHFRFMRTQNIVAALDQGVKQNVQNTLIQILLLVEYIETQTITI